MADIEKRVVVSVEADDAIKTLEDIKSALNETNNNVKKVNENAEKSKKGFKSMADGAHSVANGFKAIMASLGIIALLGKLSEMFMKNEKVAKLVGTAMNFLQITINKVVDVVSAVYNRMTELWQSMDHTKEVISSLITIAINPFKLAFFEISLAIKALQLAWEKSIFGKKDEGRIKELTADIGELKTKITDTVKSSFKEAKDVITNVVGAGKEIINAGKEAIKVVKEEVKDFSVKTAWATAAAAAAAKKNFGLIALEAQNLADKLETEAEKQRQIRDNVNKSYEERQVASEKLKSILDEQEQALLAVAKAHLAEAQAAYAVSKSEEDLIAVKTAENEVNKVATDMAGKRSEQLNSENGLIKEQIDLKAQLSAADTARNNKLKIWQASRIKDEGDRLDAQIKANEEAYNSDLETLNKQLKLYEFGTAAYENTVKAIDDLAAQHTIDMGTFADQRAEYEKQKIYEVKAERDKAIEDEKNAKWEAAKSIMNDIATFDNAITQGQIDNATKLLNQKKITQEEFDKKVAEIQKKAAKRQKAFAIASTIIDTAGAIVKMLKDPGGTAGVILSIAAGITGAASIATILATPADGTSTAGSAPSAPSIPSTGEGTAPNTSFSFSPTPEKPQGPQVIKTYVLSKDVETQQQLDRQVIANATI